MRFGVISVALVAVAGMALAQSEKPAAPSGDYFRLDFVVKELDGGKVVNSRAYSTIISTEHGGQSSIRTSSRVPVATREGGSSYFDLAVNVDCKSPRAVGSDFAVNLVVEINGLADPASTPPVYRSNRWGGDVIVPVKKPTVVFSSDDATSKRQMQLELTATPIR